MKNWYSIKNQGAGVLNVSIHDEIGVFGVSAAQFLAELREAGDVSAINVSIHSPGGNMLDGFAMYNGLKNHPAKVYTHIEGIAASMAGIVFMAGDVRTMPENAFIMTHAPRGGGSGTANDMRELADVMDKFRDSAFNIFDGAMNLPADEIMAFLDDETWFNGEEAYAKGFAHSLTAKVEISAKINGFDRHVKSMPVDNTHKDISTISNIKDFERYLRDVGGLSKGVATALASRAKVVFRSDSDNKPSEGLAEIHNAMMRMKVPANLTQ